MRSEVVESKNMSTDRSDRAYGYWLEAAQKFDYFVTGVCLALISYLAGTLKATPIGFNSSTLQLLSIISILMAALSGLKQIEATVTCLAAMHRRLYREETAGVLMGAATEGRPILNRKTGDVMTAEDAILRAHSSKEAVQSLTTSQDKWIASANRWYKWRNRLLLIGLSGVIISRTIAGYGR
jgi:hypothetical protein